ncbi:hypothetical protein [Stenotrophomonas rhizophila]
MWDQGVVKMRLWTGLAKLFQKLESQSQSRSRSQSQSQSEARVEAEAEAEAVDVMVDQAGLAWVGWRDTP